MAPGKRAQRRAEIESEILRLSREQLSTVGAAALSLRAIARDLGMVSSAIYRYVAGRDELLTLLLVEGYSELADAAETALSDDTGPRRRITAIATAMRSWAVDDPARWALLYGSPVPGYTAPAEQTTGPGTRIIALLLTELAEASAAGLLGDATPPGEIEGLTAIGDEFGVSLPPGVLLAGTTLWSGIVGAISLEVFGQFGPDFPDPEALFIGQLDRHLELLFDRP